MKKQILFITLIALSLGLMTSCKKSAPYKALIVTGQNNHHWEASSPILRDLLEATDLFSADIATSPAHGADMSTFQPDFAKYNLVVLDYNGDAWSAKTQAAFLDYVSKGGGVVVYHAADNSFPEWKEYNQIIGLGGWGNRTEKDGPYVYYQNNTLVRDTAAGRGGSHAKRAEFEVKIRNAEHPITKGLPPRWIHGADELYSELRGPAENMEILATARSPKKPDGTDRDEPMLMTITYGKGRIFHTALGHADKDGGPALQCVGFIVTFQRGAEWAATGKVTQPIPYDFPNAGAASIRVGFKPLTLEDDLDHITTYDVSKSTKYFVDLQSRIRAEGKSPEALQSFEKKMIKILKDNSATIDGKILLLHELSWMGSDLSVPTIQELQKNPNLKEAADYALARLKPGK